MENHHRSHLRQQFTEQLSTLEATLLEPPTVYPG